jgi:hypothetical protein
MNKGVHVMANLLPPPTVPDLLADNAIDLEYLGSANLRTFINYPGIAGGDVFWPNWRGCSAQGEVVDTFTVRVRVEDDQLEPQGYPVDIDNSLLQRLDQGWVFYSYMPEAIGQPDDRGEESQRRFFYVGKRPAVSVLLPVPQFKESHELCVDLDLLSADVTVATLPYRAMSVGDKVTFTWKGFFDDGVPMTPYTRNKTLADSDVGQPLKWVVPLTELQFIADGYAEMSYSIVYASPTETSVSAMQTLRIVKPVAPLLPAISVKGAVGDLLDPEAFPDGITLAITLYPGILVGDDVVLYASGELDAIRTIRVDPSTITSGILEFTLDYAWLSANNGKEVTLIYQYARLGGAGTGVPVSLTLRKPLYLPPPIVEKATAESGEEDEYKGFLLARSTLGGVYIMLPNDAVIGADDKVQMHWEGYGNTGRYIADPTVGDPQRFYIPPQAVPANLGKRLDVSYRVTPPGEAPYKSVVFDLLVKDIDSGLPTIQCPDAPGGWLSLVRVLPEGVGFTLGSWMFMAEGQRVRVKATGFKKDGTEETIYLREGSDEPVTKTEYDAGTLYSNLQRAFLENLALDVQFDVIVETSFDEGDSYKKFPTLPVTLRA